MENGKQPILDNQFEDNKGLTKREYFAGLAMQGMLSDPNASNFKPTFIDELADDFSDDLLKELDKK